MLGCGDVLSLLHWYLLVVLPSHSPASSESMHGPPSPLDEVQINSRAKGRSKFGYSAHAARPQKFQLRIKAFCGMVPALLNSCVGRPYIKGLLSFYCRGHDSNIHSEGRLIAMSARFRNVHIRRVFSGLFLPSHQWSRFFLNNGIIADTSN